MIPWSEVAAGKTNWAQGSRQVSGLCYAIIRQLKSLISVRYEGQQQIKIGVIGAGPAGLTAAYLLSGADVDVEVWEADPRYVGGISRTEVYKDFRFDIGGHRFFSKSKEVEDLWSQILPHDMLECERLSRIYYDGKFYSYPLGLAEVVGNLGSKRSGVGTARGELHLC